jgi:UDP-glucuronate decarboxylase
MRRVLVTGGAGFIGSHLCERLIAAGDEVICLDNFFTGRRENLSAIIDHPRFELVRHDIVEPILLEVDRIYNLACPASPVHFQSNPVKTVKTNVLGALHVLGMAKRVGARVLQASTSEVYGDPEVHPQPESYWGNVNPVGLRSCYDEGKRVAETLVYDYQRQHDLEVRVARIFNTYGPRLLRDDGRVVASFIVKALAGEPIVVYGTGSHTRSFCYVDDMVDGLIALMESDCSEPVNLGNPSELTIGELAHRVIALTGSQSQVVFGELPADDPKRRQPDISRAKATLGWSPRIGLDDGLERTVDYFANNGEARGRLGAP